MRIHWLIVILVILTVDSFCQGKEYHGTFLVSGTGTLDDSVSLRTFVSLLKLQSNSHIVFIPTASSGLKLPNGYIFIPPKGDTTHAYVEAFEKELTQLFGVQKVTLLHSPDRNKANSDSFVVPLKDADGVWISSGNAGRLADAYLGTNTQKEIQRLVERGDVVGGNSAGAIIMGSYIVRGWTEKPMLMAKGHDKGFGLLPQVAINPHLLTAKREYELISVIHEYPKLLGIGIDDYTSLIIKNNEFTVIGKSKVAIYDNKKYGDKWYYWLSPGDRYDLARRRKIE